MAPDALSIFDVFTPTRFPTYSYVARRDNYEETIEFCINESSIAFIHGPTKSGKTVLAERVAQKANARSTKVNARNYRSANDFWQVVASQMGIPETVSSTRRTGEGHKRGISWLAKVSAWLAEASATGTIERSTDKETAETRTVGVDPVTGIKSRPQRTLLIIDNFHYIQERSVQKEILREVRNLLGHVSVVIIAIAEKSDYLSTIERELIGRYQSITIAEWSDQELMEIADIGFKRLNVEISASVRRDLLRESLGAPAIMQAICLRLGVRLDLSVASPTPRVVSQNEVVSDFRKACRDASRLFDMTSTYDAVLELVDDGQQVSKRCLLKSQPARSIEDDKIVFPGEAVLQVLATQQSMRIVVAEIEMKYKSLLIARQQYTLPDTRAMLKDLHAASEIIWQSEIRADGQQPSGNGDAANTLSETSLIVYNEAKDTVAIMDPYFAFFVRWSGYIKGVS